MEDSIIKIGSNGKISKYIEKCKRQLRTSNSIKLRGVKKAIPKTISIAEILKRKNIEFNLAQTTKLKYITIADDSNDDTENDGFIGTNKTKKVSMIEITLVKVPQASNTQLNQEEKEKDVVTKTRDETLIKKRDPNVEYKII